MSITARPGEPPLHSVDMARIYNLVVDDPNADNGPRLQAALTENAARGAILELPRANIYCNTFPTTVEGSKNIVIRGAGAAPWGHDPRTAGVFGTSLINKHDTAGDVLITHKGAQACRYEDLTFVGCSSYLVPVANRAIGILDKKAVSSVASGVSAIIRCTFLDCLNGIKHGELVGDPNCADWTYDTLGFFECGTGFQMMSYNSLDHHWIGYNTFIDCPCAVDVQQGGLMEMIGLAASHCGRAARRNSTPIGVAGDVLIKVGRALAPWEAANTGVLAFLGAHTEQDVWPILDAYMAGGTIVFSRYSDNTGMTSGITTDGAAPTAPSYANVPTMFHARGGGLRFVDPNLKTRSITNPCVVVESTSVQYGQLDAEGGTLYQTGGAWDRDEWFRVVNAGGKTVRYDLRGMRGGPGNGTLLPRLCNDVTVETL